MSRYEHIGDVIEKNVDVIATHWLETPAVVEIFKLHKISIQKFKPKFAVGIILHFSDVVQGRKMPGECPLMNYFIDYMLKKGIEIREVFQVCTQLRRVLLQFLVTKRVLSLSDVNRLLELFDQNLGGVLNYFLEKRSASEHDLSAAEKLKSLQILANQQESLIVTLKDGQVFLANNAFLHFAGAAAIGEVSPIWGYFDSVTLHPGLFETGSYETWVGKLADHDHTILHAFLIGANRQKQRYRIRINTMPCAFNDGSAYHVLTMTRDDASLDLMENHFDLLTKLYNRRKFDEQLADLSEQEQGAVTILVMHFLDLGLINDTYGKEIGDVVLQEFAAHAEEAYRLDGLLTRFEGDKFALIGTGIDLEKAYELAEEARTIVRSIVFDETIGRYPKMSVAIGLGRTGEGENVLMARIGTLLERMSREKEEIRDDTELFEDEHKRLKEEEEFLKEAAAWKAAQRLLSVVIYYKEVPVESESQILEILDDAVVLQVRSIAVHAAKAFPVAYIRLRQQRYDIMAEVRHADVAKHTVELTRIAHVTQSPLDRQSVHVLLQHKLPVTLYCREGERVGELLSMSLKYAQISVPNIAGLSVGEEVGLSTDLPFEEGNRRLHVEGEILKITREGNAGEKSLIVGFADEAREPLRTFVSHRQQEIVQELQGIAHH